MPDAKFEPMVLEAMNDLLDFLKRHPDVRGTVYGRTDELIVTIKIENERIAHCDP